ncbi:MAG: hypothetical protein ACPGEG_08730 [Salibacteraceae bacterium]
MKPEPKKSILELSDNLFGKDYIDEAQLTIFLSDPNTKVITEVSDEGNLMGFSIVRKLDWQGLKSEFYEYPKQLEKHFNQDQIIGFRKSTGVSPQFQNQGLASKMTLEGNQWLEEKCDLLVSICWVKKGEPEFSKILRKDGFKELEKLQNVWYQESLDKNYQCGVCGQPPCNCEAIVYAKHIH